MNHKTLFNKEENEKKILQMIYKPKNYISITKREEPDFELVLPSKTTFGVEVTELFLSESNARLKYIPNYFDEIMDKKLYRHKDDKTFLDVKEITILSEDGTPYRNVDALVFELPSIEDYSVEISKIINVKSEKCLSYDSKLNHINLIIYDNVRKLSTIDREAFYSLVFKMPLIQSLIRTTFREIFFITKLNDNKEIAFPLKLLYFLAQLFFINGFLNKTCDETNLLDFKNELEFCAGYLTSKGCKDIYVIGEKSEYELLYSNYGVLIQNQGIVIHYYDDNPLPANAKPYWHKQSTHTVLSESIIKKIDAFICENVFETSIGIDTSNADFDFA